MVPVEGTEEVIPADLVLIAAGFLGSQKYVTDAFKRSHNPSHQRGDKAGSLRNQRVREFSQPATCTEASLL